MRYRQLGSFGPTVSVVGLGASHFGRMCDLQQTRAVVRAALDAGITFIDTIRTANAVFDRLDKLQRFARERDISLLELAIGGVAALPCVGPVIAGATTPGQIQANAAAADWVPSAADLAALNAL